MGDEGEQNVAPVVQAAAVVAATQVTYRVTPPSEFDFRQPESWTKWIRRFERFRQASRLYTEPETNQVNSLIYHMGDEAEDVMSSMNLDVAEARTYQTVLNKFRGHFVMSKNVIFERAMFNKRVQEDGETADAYINSLHILSEHCDYGELREDLIRDRIVVGIRDTGLSLKMQVDSDLTLAKAIKLSRQREMVNIQQSVLRNKNEEAQLAFVNSKYKKPNKNHPNKSNSKSHEKKHSKKYHASESKSCHRCGATPSHKWEKCPAREAVCHTCNRKGHFGKVCRNAKQIDNCELNTTVVNSEAEGYDEFFIGELLQSTSAKSNPWMVNVLVNGKVQNFKLDTGADVSVMSYADFQKINLSLEATKKRLFGPNKSQLDVAGVFSADLRKGDKSSVQEVYVVPGLTQPLLGRPAIEALELLVRADSITVEDVKKQYPKLFDGLGTFEGEYDIVLKEDAKPVALYAPRRVAIPLLGKVKEELRKMEDMDVITPITEATDWCSGLVVVPKPNSGVRLCVDLTQLNNSVKREIHPMPSVEHIVGQITGARYFSRLDANSGFYQIKLSERSSKLTTFVTPFGRFRFKRLPFGISSAPEVFQREMSRLLDGLPGVICLMDDVLIFGVSQAEHDSRLAAVLQKLSDSGVTLNLQKCEFGKRKLRFVGQIISEEGIEADPSKVSAVTDMKSPENTTELRRFLGFVNQLSKFSSVLAEKSKPLRDLLRKDKDYVWSEVQQLAFEEIKHVISRAPVLAMFDPKKKTMVSSDASQYGLGSVLKQQQHNGEWRPVMFASRSLSDTECRYAQIEKEALAITWATERFNDFLLGKDFSVETDHKPLVSILGRKSLDELSPRLQRFRMRLMRYQFTVFYTPGKNLHVADTLSRAPVDSSMSPEERKFEAEVRAHVDAVYSQFPASDDMLSEIATQQELSYSRVPDYIQNGWPPRHQLIGEEKQLYQIRDQLSVVNGLLVKGKRLIIPPSMRPDMLAKIHSGHLGLRKCRERATGAVWWPGLSVDIKNCVTNCETCAQYRPNHIEPLIPTATPQRPWERVGSDLFELRKDKYLLVVDYLSRYVEVAKLTSTSSEEIIRQMKSMFSRHGVPNVVMSDNGPQYSSETFKNFAKTYNFKHVTSSPLYPKSNGAAERAVQSVKNLLRKASDPYLSLLEYRATPVSQGLSPAELLMGRKLRTVLPVLPSQLIPKQTDLPQFRSGESKKKLQMKTQYDERHRATEMPELNPGDKVWVDKTPCTVLQKADTPRSYYVSSPRGKIRRNRIDLRKIPPIPEPESNDNSSVDQSKPPEIGEQLNIPSTLIKSSANQENVYTRSGRAVKAPDRLNL